MAGSNKIKFLRGTSDKRSASSDILNQGQPFFETDTGIFYVGNDTSLKNAKPIKATALAHNHDDMYYTEAEVDTKVNTAYENARAFAMSTADSLNSKISEKANINHTHSQSEIGLKQRYLHTGLLSFSKHVDQGKSTNLHIPVTFISDRASYDYSNKWALARDLYVAWKDNINENLSMPRYDYYTTMTVRRYMGNVAGATNYYTAASGHISWRITTDSGDRKVLYVANFVETSQTGDKNYEGGYPSTFEVEDMLPYLTSQPLYN